MFDDSFKRLYKNVPMAVWSQVDGTVKSEFHNHAEIEISLRTKGETNFFLSDQKLISRPGDISIKNPFEIHCGKSRTEKVSGHEICFDCSLIADEKIADDLKNGRIHLKNLIPSDDENIEEIQRLFMNIIDCYKNNSDYVYLEVKAHISIFIAYLLNNGYVDIGYSEGKDETFYKTVFQYISQNYKNNITSKDVSYALSYNHSYFCRKFRKNFNRKFYDYLNMYRVFESRKLFSDGEKSVTRIALESGFNSQTYFTKCFKKYTGLLPSEYIKNIQGTSKNFSHEY